MEKSFSKFLAAKKKPRIGLEFQLPVVRLTTHRNKPEGLRAIE